MIYIFLFVATIGNTIGSFINYLLGKYFSAFALSRSYFKERSVTKAKNIFDRYGFIALLLSWMPVIGDPLTFVAGVFKYNWLKFLGLVAIAKFIRYAVILYAFEFAVNA